MPSTSHSSPILLLSPGVLFACMSSPPNLPCLSPTTHLQVSKRRPLLQETLPHPQAKSSTLSGCPNHSPGYSIKVGGGGKGGRTSSHQECNKIKLNIGFTWARHCAKHPVTCLTSFPTVLFLTHSSQPHLASWLLHPGTCISQLIWITTYSQCNVGRTTAFIILWFL